MSKYGDMQICSCGSIHLIPEDKLSSLLGEDKDLLLICANCGNAILIGADKCPNYDNPNDTDYYMYHKSFTCNDKEWITKKIFNPTIPNEKPVGKILYEKGIRVPMMTGNYANFYFSGKFYDYSPISEYDMESLLSNSKKEIIKNMKDLEIRKSTVNMNRLCKENTNEELDYISKFLIESLKWKGTIYEKVWS